MLTVETSHGEQCQETLLGTGDYQTLTTNFPHSLRNKAQIPEVLESPDSTESLPDLMSFYHWHFLRS